jgi:hypothetical protein
MEQPEQKHQQNSGEAGGARGFSLDCTCALQETRDGSQIPEQAHARAAGPQLACQPHHSLGLSHHILAVVQLQDLI